MGHGARSLQAFLDLLRGAGVELVVDVRTVPGSRRHPHFGGERLATALRAAGIAYEWERDLGGLRRPSPDSLHTALRDDALRGYADHMQTEAFRAALVRLLKWGSERPTAFMCAESDWRRCHRRLLADALLARVREVDHLQDGGRTEPHRRSPTARVLEAGLVYDVAEAGQARLDTGT